MENEKTKLGIEKTRIAQKMEETGKNVRSVEKSKKDEIEKTINDLENQNKLEDELENFDEFEIYFSFTHFLLCSSF